jgi:hypothetical protein
MKIELVSVVDLVDVGCRLVDREASSIYTLSKVCLRAARVIFSGESRVVLTPVSYMRIARQPRPRATRAYWTQLANGYACRAMIR